MIQIQIQKQLRICLISNFTYLPLFFIVQIPKILNKSEFKIKRNYSSSSNNNNSNNNKNNKKKIGKKEQKEI